MVRLGSATRERSYPNVDRSTATRVSVNWLVWATSVGCVQSQEVLTRTINNLSEAGVGQTQDASYVPPTPPSSSERKPDEWSDASFEHPSLTDVWPDAGFVQPTTTTPEVFVGTGYHSTCASVFGELYCWGDNKYGQLGTPPDRDLERPLRIRVDFVPTVIDGGERHMCALDTRGLVHCWGSNDSGQLGQVEPREWYAPTQVELPEPVRVLSSGERHVCVIGQSAQLYCWGSNQDGQLGLGQRHDEDDDYKENDDDEHLRDTMWPAAPVGDNLWLTVSAGQGHTCGIHLEGTLWCWGRNRNRQAGQFDGESFDTPRQVGEDDDWTYVVAGHTHSCALRKDLSLWCWGSNVEGKPYPLGGEWTDAEDDPQYVSGVEWRSIHTRSMSSCGLTLDDEGLCWGRNDEGQLGLGDFELRDTPTFVGRGGAQLSTGLLHACGTTQTLDVYCTGSNESGQLGVGDYESRNEFTHVRF